MAVAFALVHPRWGSAPAPRRPGGLHLPRRAPHKPAHSQSYFSRSGPPCAERGGGGGGGGGSSGGGSGGGDSGGRRRTPFGFKVGPLQQALTRFQWRQLQGPFTAPPLPSLALQLPPLRWVINTLRIVIGICIIFVLSSPEVNKRYAEREYLLSEKAWRESKTAAQPKLSTNVEQLLTQQAALATQLDALAASTSRLSWKHDALLAGMVVLLVKVFGS